LVNILTEIICLRLLYKWEQKRGYVIEIALKMYMRNVNAN